MSKQWNSEFDDEQFPEDPDSPEKPERRQSFLSIFFSVALFLVAIGLLSYFIVSKNISNMLKDHDKAERVIPDMFNDTAQISDQFKKVILQINKGNFKMAEKELNSISNQSGDTFDFLAGFCNEQAQNFEKSINSYRKIPSQSPLFENATFRLAMTFWKSGNKDKSKETFQAIKSDSLSPFSTTAAEILTEMGVKDIK